MTAVILMKVGGGMLAPADEQSREVVERWKLGQGVHADVRRMRNYLFHKKFFAMINLGFDAWEPPELEHRGLPVGKNFERFRKDCMIAAGFYEPVANLKGEVRAEAKSISFANMEEDEFEKVYSSVVDVLLERVLTKYTRADLDEVVERLISFT